MAAFLAMMRRLFLGAIIVSIMSICMKSQGILSPILPWGNTKSDYCQVCGYDGEIKINDNYEWECPVCQDRKSVV